MYVFLIGFMGSGKTYVGKRLAASLHVPFIDLDVYIHQQEKRSITQIFADSGEEHFRVLEKRYLRQLTRQFQGVIATGGGAPCFYENMKWMNKKGTTVFLDVSIPTILQRLKQKRNTRPLIANKNDAELNAFIIKKSKERRLFYDKAKVVVKISNDSTWAVKALTHFIK